MNNELLPCRTQLPRNPRMFKEIETCICKLKYLNYQMEHSNFDQEEQQIQILETISILETVAKNATVEQPPPSNEVLISDAEMARYLLNTCFALTGSEGIHSPQYEEAVTYAAKLLTPITIAPALSNPASNEVQVLRDALAFYADEEHYQLGEYIGHDYPVKMVLHDKGMKAKAALAAVPAPKPADTSSITPENLQTGAIEPAEVLEMPKDDTFFVWLRSDPDNRLMAYWSQAEQSFMADDIYYKFSADEVQCFAKIGQKQYVGGSDA